MVKIGLVLATKVLEVDQKMHGNWKMAMTIIIAIAIYRMMAFILMKIVT